MNLIIGIVIICIVLPLYFVLIEYRFLKINKSKYIYAHELGHAQAAKDAIYPPFILMKGDRTSDIQNKIPCYRVTEEDFLYAYNREGVAAVALYDDESFCYETMKQITKAGPRGEKRWLLHWKRQLPVLCQLSLFALILQFFCTPSICLGLNSKDVLAFLVMIHFAFMWFILETSKGSFKKRSMNELKKELEGLSEGGEFTGGVSDGEKLKYWNNYVECLEIIKKKKLKCKNNYHEVLEKLKERGYTIYSSEVVQEEVLQLSGDADCNRESRRKTETEYKAPPIETVAHPWLRFFARMLELNLTTVLWKAFSALLLHYNSNNVFLGSLYDSYIAFLLLLMLEPLFLSTWGTTPGKKLLGLVIRDTSGNKLSYKKALARTWGVFGAGCGYNIPIYSQVRLYQSYKQCSMEEPLTWEEDTSLSIKNTKYYRRVIYAGMFLLLLGIVYIIGLQAVMPIHRGELTAAQYAENCNNYMNYIDYGTFMRLDDTGNWVDKNPKFITYSEFPPHKIIIKDGKVTGIELEVEIKDGGYVSSYQNQQWIAIMGFVAAQREMNCFQINSSDLVKAVRNPFKNYTEYEAGIRVKNEIEYTGYSISDRFLIPTGENPYFHMRFTLEKMD